MNSLHNIQRGDVFDKLIKRLESIEETLVACKEQQAETKQQLVALISRNSKRSDSERTLGVAFSGSNWCDHQVKLIAKGTFDEEGKFGKGLMIVDISAFFGISLTRTCWNWDHEWNQHIIAAWGHEQYNRVKTSVLEYLPKYATSQEVGITGIGHLHADDALFETALRKRHKGLIAVGQDRIATSLNTLTEIISLVDNVCEDMFIGVTTKLVFYPINAKLQKLALAMVRGTGIEEEVLLMNFEQQQILQKNDIDPLSFFYKFFPGQRSRPHTIHDTLHTHRWNGN